MTPIYDLQLDACIRDWLIRVNTQYDKATSNKVKEADYDRAKKSLGLGNITRNCFFFLPQSASRGWFSSGDTTTHSNNRTYIDQRTIYNNASVCLSSDSEQESTESSKVSKKKKTKEKTIDWKNIAVIVAVSTAIAGISLFVYARLSKAAEGAVNYLENTKEIKNRSNINTCNLYSDFRAVQLSQINQIAQVQEKIDQRTVDKITNYKYSILTSLVGTLAIAGGGMTLLASASTLATAGITAVVVGGVLNSIAVMYAAYNCGMHWSDEENGKKEFNKVKQLISGLKEFFEREYQRPPAYHSHQDVPPPSYEDSERAQEEAIYQAIYNQRRGIYPDLPRVAPSAPYEPLIVD
ncbi:MAG: hypothetical protein LBC45_02935 [Chlamydiales bacterium]|jgi:hypothetical protein|nr:hypothetical protein [Chlamydiales bacterium]